MFLKVEIHSNNVTWHKAGKCQSWTVSVSSCLIFTWNSSPEEVCGGTGQDTALHHPDGCNFGLIFFSLVPCSFILFFLLIHRNKREGKNELFIFYLPVCFFLIKSIHRSWKRREGYFPRFIFFFPILLNTNHILLLNFIYEVKGSISPLPCTCRLGQRWAHTSEGHRAQWGEFWVQLVLKCWSSFLLYGLFIYLFILKGKKKRWLKGWHPETIRKRSIVNKYCFPKPVIPYRENLWGFWAGVYTSSTKFVF